MKNTTTTNTDTNTKSLRSRFNYLKAIFRQSQLNELEINELKTLAKKFHPKMAKQMDENPELC